MATLTGLYKASRLDLNRCSHVVESVVKSCVYWNTSGGNLTARCVSNFSGVQRAAVPQELHSGLRPTQQPTHHLLQVENQARCVTAVPAIDCRSRLLMVDPAQLAVSSKCTAQRLATMTC